MIYSKYGYRRLVKFLPDLTGSEIYDLVILSKLLLSLRHTVPSKNKSIANILVNIYLGKYLSNFHQKRHVIGSLKWVWIKKIKKSKKLCEDAKLITKRYLKFRVDNCNATDVNQEKTKVFGAGRIRPLPHRAIAG